MNLINPKLTLFFEIRKSNQCLVEDFCQELVGIGNLYLAAIYFPLTYTSQDLSLEVSSAQLTLKSQPCHNHSFSAFVPQAGLKIEDCFTFLRRTLRCHLYKRHEGEDCPSLKPNEVELPHLGEYPIRDLRVENLHRHSIAPELREDSEIALATTTGKCYCCEMWC